jgi:predicted methyltransferase
MSKMSFKKTQIGDWGQIYCGDCMKVLKILPCNSIDSIVTDPP